MKIEASNSVPRGTQISSSKSAVQPTQNHPVEVDTLTTTGRGLKPSVGSAFNLSPNYPGPISLALVRPAAKQGPLARLPLELKTEILSWLKNENEQVQQMPRAVSRAFCQASVVGLPKVNDRIASGYLRRILRQENLTQDEVETFLIEHAPRMRIINVADSYREENSAKAALLHRVLSYRDVTLQSIILRGCTAMLELPQELTRVSGDLDIGGTRITQLPQRLTVGGDLNLSGTGITELPQGLTVGGGLDINRTCITQLPQGLTVGGGLDLRLTCITQLPQGLTVGGNFYLSGTHITQLPQGLTVGGGLYLFRTEITQLPEDLKVSGEIFR